MPTAPRNTIVVAIVGSANELVVTWREPEVPGGIIDNYTIECNGSIIDYSISSLPRFFNDSVYFSTNPLQLLPDTVYSCTVQAHNDVGYGPKSAPDVARTGQHCKSQFLFAIDIAIDF